MACPVLPGIKACVFDAYGTLFDFATAAGGCRDVLGDKTEAVTELWRQKQLAYSWLRAAQGRHADFWQVTGEALDVALKTLEIDIPGVHTRLMNLYLALAPFPEVVDVLARVRRAGLKTAILSNGTPAMLKSVIDAAGLASAFDAVLSVEEAGVYKPHPRVYQLAVDRLGVPCAAIAFQSSNAWDAHAAAAFGMTAVWCNRAGAPCERLPGKLACTIKTLAALPPLIGAD